MKEKKTIFQVFSLFDKRERIALFGVFLLTLSLAITEMIGVGIIFPFIATISNPSIIMENRFLHFFYEVLPVSSEQEFTIWFAGAVLAFVLFKNVYYAFVIYVQQTYLIAKRVELTTLLYEGYLRKPYPFHLKNNSAMLLRNLNQVDGIFSALLQPLFLVIAEALTIVSITCLLFYTNPLMTIGIVLLAGTPALLVTKLLKSKFGSLGKKNHELMGVTSKSILEGLGAIKEIQVMNSSGFFSMFFAKNSKLLGYVRRDQQVMNQFPRLVIEVVVVGAIVSVILFLVFRGGSLTEALPLIALFCAAAIRQMASINKLIAGFNSIHSAKILQDTICLELLELKSGNVECEIINTSPVAHQGFRNSLKLDQVSYCYEGASEDAVHKVSLEIPKGSSVAFVGASGSGKSTLVNMILGLLPPGEGVVSADGKNIQECLADWRKCIGYVSQEVFLCDASLRKNIAFAIPDELIDEEAISQAVEASQLGEVVRNLPQGINTNVGERGIRLSGGQRQRIAIARALYHKPGILILDEATSALDGKTESDVTTAIELLSGEKTLIIIAHRLSTVRQCDRLYFMRDGEVVNSGSYEFLIQNDANFQELSGKAQSVDALA